MILRYAAPFDVAEIEAVEESADRMLVEHLAPPAWPGIESAESRLSMPGFLLVADTGEHLVGFVHVIEFGDSAHLEQLSVVPEYGRQGVGTELLTAAIDNATARGHSRLTLRTFRDVPWNAPFYARHGFAPSEPATDFHRELVDIERDLGLEQAGPRIQMTLEW